MSMTKGTRVEFAGALGTVVATKGDQVRIIFDDGASWAGKSGWIASELVRRAPKRENVERIGGKVVVRSETLTPVEENYLGERLYIRSPGSTGKGVRPKLTPLNKVYVRTRRGRIAYYWCEQCGSYDEEPSHYQHERYGDTGLI